MAYALTTVRAEERLTREEGASGREQQSGHTSVLKEEVVRILDPQNGDLVVDATLGLGGHSEALLASANVTLIGIDDDRGALAAARERLNAYSSRTRLVEGNFRDLGALLERLEEKHIQKALFDLGWNSTQLGQSRGFSFQANEELLMSYGEKPVSGFTAKEILNSWTEEGIANALFGYGEERYAKRIAHAIVLRRDVAPIETTQELVKIIQSSTPVWYRRGKIHPATRTFQALRIAVNDELGSIERGIKAAWEALLPGGRIAVITFHSIEDRLVKRMFAELSKEGGKLLLKKPLRPTREEIEDNPRSRSAKLRAIEKVIT